MHNGCMNTQDVRPKSVIGTMMSTWGKPAELIRNKVATDRNQQPAPNSKRVANASRSRKSCASVGSGYTNSDQRYETCGPRRLVKKSPGCG
jgi:hypothetical protein